jgi:putative DNA primase/helicase
MSTAENVFQINPGGVAPPETEPAPVTEIMPAPSAPLDVARVLEQELAEDGKSLAWIYRGDWWRYVGPHWVEWETAAIRKWLYERLEHCQYMAKNKDGEPEPKPWSPDKAKIDKLLDAMTAPFLLDRATQAPTWLSTGQDAAGLVPCTNGLVDVTTGQIIPSTPDYFGTTCIPFDYDPNVGPAVEWLKFLRTIWKPVAAEGCDPAKCTEYPGSCKGWHEAEEIKTLQQWFGYVLSGRLDLHKMLLLQGPPRCGKGTIARVLTSLVGKANTSSPTMSALATNFGLEDAVGKSLAVVGDARLASQGQETVVERLLMISGQDPINIDRKNRTVWRGTVSARIMILSNEAPKFLDASGAIASRFVILKIEEGWLGREDITLGARLAAELPAILKWALGGITSLTAAGRIVEPTSHIEAMQEMYDLVSPIGAFVRDVCTVGAEQTVAFSTLYHEYEQWCRENTRGITNTARFSSDMKARLPLIKTDYRPRDELGRRMPRHVVGLAISTEWSTRVREQNGVVWGSSR